MDNSLQSSGQVKRDVAVKTRIRYILEGSYVKEEGWKPNYIRTLYGEVFSRVNIIGVVVSDPVVEYKSQSILVDDGSDRIVLRSFDDGLVLSKFVVGDIVNVVGKPREYMGNKYIIPEILKRVDDKKWFELRNKELDLKYVSANAVLSSAQPVDDVSAGVEESVVDVSDVDMVLGIIRSLDKGDGVLVDDILFKFGDNGTERLISSLLEQGDIFEIQPGRVKILE